MKGFFDGVYAIFACGTALAVLCFLMQYLFGGSAKSRLDFILKAQKAGCITPGKMTCLTLEGSPSLPHYKAEYMYIVNNKQYFVTYQMEVKKVIDTAKDEFDADMLVTNLKKYMMLFYSETSPSTVMCKAEVFASKYAIKQVPTPKHNVHRNVDKDWTEAIQLLSYS